VYAVSAGKFGPMVMGNRQKEEKLLTAAQSPFAVAILANLSFSLGEALLIFVLFFPPLLLPYPPFRYYFSYLFIALPLGLIIFKRDSRHSMLALFQRGQRPQAAEGD